ncbi:MAG: class II aldolase/adducin family protein [Opitutaceae bacterium]|nr:class II aldolase/adducin family protein [Opitutaceae bacterium]MBP9913866.1 class II aldolase/adducin family protein [Opitutaceae bacterium]
MRKVITAADVEQLLRTGAALDTIPADAILTPSARDLMRSRRIPARPSDSKPIAAKTDCGCAHAVDLKNPASIEQFFNSPALEAIKVKMCDIGRRMWTRNYVDGNGGNLTVRVSDELVLCTPTLISKGFMTPADMCLIDLEGRQVAGTKKRTSEALTHLGIMKRQPKARACVHAHPVHATAFAVASVVPPPCLIPEAEVFVGPVGLAEYRTPGTAENANAVGVVGVDHQVVLMQNHGVITWGNDVEDAYWKMENIEAYCQTVAIASSLGSGLRSIGTEKLKDLIALRQKLGMEDTRLTAATKDCDLCAPGDFRAATINPPAKN